MNEHKRRGRLDVGQKQYLAFVWVLGGMCVVLSFLLHSRWHDSALLYMAIPMCLATLLAVLVKPKSILSTNLKGLTTLLLLSMVIFREGTICVLMAAPILYVIVGIVSVCLDGIRRHEKSKRLKSSAMLLVIALMSLEGTHPLLTMERGNTIEVSRVLSADMIDIERTLAQPMVFDLPRKWSTVIFPKPVASSGEGLSVGDTRLVEYVYYKHVYFNPHVGETEYQVVHRTPQSVTFGVTKDTSYLSNYLTWKSSTVSWEAVANNLVKVTWELSYDRDLDPAWYFAPLQAYYVTHTAEYLLDNLATTARAGR